MTFELSSFSKKELLELLWHLKTYRTLKKRLGKKAKPIFDTKMLGTKILRIEHSSNLSQEEIKKLLVEIFGADYQKDFSIQWDTREDLIWGIRVFFDDELIDLSFLQTKQRIQTRIL